MCGFSLPIEVNEGEAAGQFHEGESFETGLVKLRGEVGDKDVGGGDDQRSKRRLPDKAPVYLAEQITKAFQEWPPWCLNVHDARRPTAGANVTRCDAGAAGSTCRTWRHGASDPS